MIEGLKGNGVKRVKISYKKGNWPARMGSTGELTSTNLVKTPVEFTRTKHNVQYANTA
jgi:hypothetical protein